MRSFRSKPVGWRGESHRHYLAAKYGSVKDLSWRGSLVKYQLERVNAVENEIANLERLRAEERSKRGETAEFDKLNAKIAERRDEKNVLSDRFIKHAKWLEEKDPGDFHELGEEMYMAKKDGIVVENFKPRMHRTRDEIHEASHDARIRSEIEKVWADPEKMKQIEENDAAVEAADERKEAFNRYLGSLQVADREALLQKIEGVGRRNRHFAVKRRWILRARTGKIVGDPSGYDSPEAALKDPVADSPYVDLEEL